MNKLITLLDQIDRRGYKAYKQLQGEYLFSDFLLRIDHVQGDPFADPSRCRVFVDAEKMGLDKGLYANKVRRVALEDYLGRQFAVAIKHYVKGRKGAGKSGEVLIACYGQQVLQRNAVLVRDGDVEVRFQVGLPADGRSINARQAKVMLCEELVKVVQSGLMAVHKDLAAVRHHAWQIPRYRESHQDRYQYR